MGITRFVLKRPVTVLMALLCLIVFGISSVFNATLEQMPDMDQPMMIIMANYSGASPEDMDELVTQLIEDQVSTLEGVKSMSSTTSEGRSMIMLEYDYDTDMDEAYSDLTKSLNSIRDLPDDVEPTVMEMNNNAQASMMLTIANPSQENLYDYVDQKIVPELEKLSTVAEVSTMGGSSEYIKIELMSDMMEQYNVSISDIKSAMSAANLSYPSGSAESGNLDLSVSTLTQHDTLDELLEMPITVSGNKIIYLEDIAVVSYAEEQKGGVSRYNGEETISISLTKQQSSTAMDLSKQVQKIIKSLQNDDDDLTITVARDEADSIQDSLKDVAETMAMAVVISMIIIFLFFGDFKASMIVGSSIPTSILMSLIVMTRAGFTLNIITMSGLVLGVGMMVDNSIVVLESCFRALDKQQDKGALGYAKAALEGTNIVVASIFGSTVTTCVVFIPLVFLNGMSGQMFGAMGYTIVFCMCASLLSAIAIVPLCYMMYKPKERSSAPATRPLNFLQDAYRKIMPVLLKHKAIVMLASVGIIVATVFLASGMQTELMTADDTGTVSVSIETRPGLITEQADAILAEAESIVTAHEDVESYMLRYNNDEGTITAYLKDDRKRETNEVIKEWKPLLNQIAGANISMDIASSSTMTSSTSGIEYILQGTQYDELKSASDQITKELLARPEVSKVHSTLENAAPVVKLNIDAVKANAENITPLQIAGTVSSMLGGKEATTLNVDGDDVSVMVEYPEDEYDTIDKLKGIVLTGNAGGSVALADVADIVFQDSPNTITRKDKQYQVTITGDVPTDDARQIDAIENKLYNEVVSKHLTSTITRGLNSQDESMKEEFGNLGTAIITAIFLIFVVMAAQFESPKFSLMVMTTIPFSLIGSFGLLYLADCPISMVSLLGFLMLVGTVVNNGILYVDTVNQYRSEMDRDTALIEAGATRLRPILMTTLTTIVSMIPMALAYGDSGKSMQGLALVDVGGLVASTVLALLMLPIYYEVMSPKKKPEPHYD